MISAQLDEATRVLCTAHPAAGDIVHVEAVVPRAHQQLPAVRAPPHRPDAEPLLPVAACPGECGVPSCCEMRGEQREHSRGAQEVQRQADS